MAQVHDYREYRWGHGLSIFESKDDGQTASAVGHGTGIAMGDYLLFSNSKNPQETTRYLVEWVEYKRDPHDMWKCKLRFVPRTVKEKAQDDQAIRQRLVRWELVKEGAR